MAVQPAAGQFFGTPPAAAQHFYIGGQRAEPEQAAVARAMAPAVAQQVADTCREVWPTKKNACNLFAIEVADRLGVTLTGLADDIVDQIRGSAWTRLTDGVAARDAAVQGKLVIAGMKHDEFTTPRTEGHVAIVVPGNMNPGGWAPAGYWGSTDPVVAAKGGVGDPISLCFRAEDKAKITYACQTI